MKLKNELSAIKHENKELSILLKLEAELEEGETSDQASLRGQIVNQQQKINELSAMAVNSPKNRSCV